MVKTQSPLEISTMPQVYRLSMKDRIAQRIAHMISSGAIAVGDALPSERDLANAMGTSRETVRGALTILATRRILSIAHGARTKVISADVGELGVPMMLQERLEEYTLDEVHDARLMVEGRIAKIAAKQIDARTVERLEGLIEAQKETMQDPMRFLILDREFHTIIYKLSDNSLLSDLATTLYSRWLDYRRDVVATPDAIAQSIADHVDILDGLRAGDAEKSAAALETHEMRIYETTKLLLAKLKRRKKL